MWGDVLAALDGYRFVGAPGTVTGGARYRYALPQQYKTHVALTDGNEPTNESDTWHYTDAKATWRAESIISRVEAYCA